MLEGGEARVRPFKVPWAMDASGVLRSAAHAGEGVHRCIECFSPLGLRRGAQRRAHFAHHGSSSTCSQESVIHKLAKALIVQMVRQWRDGGPRPGIRRSCTGCGLTIVSNVPDRVIDAEPEHRLASGRVVDVALLGELGIVCAVEVLHTHAVDEAKAAAMDLPWLEVRAHDVLTDPFVLVPVQHALRPYMCGPCKRDEAALRFATTQAPRSRLENDAVLNDFVNKCLGMDDENDEIDTDVPFETKDLEDTP